MFKLGQVVVTKNSGVCEIVSEEEMNFGIGSKAYFILKPHFKEKDTGTKIYLPKEQAELNARLPMKKKEILKIIDSMPTLEKIWYSDPKVRRTKFDEIYRTGDLLNICQLVKSLHLQNEELKINKKTLSMLDREFLIKLQNDIYQEFAYVLEINLDEVESFIEKRIN